MQNNPRKRRSANQWKALIDQQAKSGVSVQKFCEQQGLSVNRFQAWASKLVTSGADFHQIKVDTTRTSEAKISCLFPSGIKLEWNNTISPSVVATIIKELS